MRLGAPCQLLVSDLTAAQVRSCREAAGKRLETDDKLLPEAAPQLRRSCTEAAGKLP